MNRPEKLNIGIRLEIKLMIDNKLEQDEVQRTAEYESIKNEIKHEVGEEISAEAGKVEQSQRINEMADDMRRKAVDEIVTTDREIGRGRALARLSQIVDYVFFVIYGLLGIRLILALFAARNQAEFVQFIKSVTDPFYAPFRGIVPSLSVDGGFTLALPIIVAIFVYLLLHLAINGFLRIFVHRKTTV